MTVEEGVVDWLLSIIRLLVAQLCFESRLICWIQYVFGSRCRFQFQWSGRTSQLFNRSRSLVIVGWLHHCPVCPSVRRDLPVEHISKFVSRIRFWRLLLPLFPNSIKKQLNAWQFAVLNNVVSRSFQSSEPTKNLESGADQFQPIFWTPAVFTFSLFAHFAYILYDCFM